MLLILTLFALLTSALKPCNKNSLGIPSHADLWNQPGYDTWIKLRYNYKKNSGDYAFARCEESYFDKYGQSLADTSTLYNCTDGTWEVEQGTPALTCEKHCSSTWLVAQNYVDATLPEDSNGIIPNMQFIDPNTQTEGLKCKTNYYRADGRNPSFKLVCDKLGNWPSTFPVTCEKNNCDTKLTSLRDSTKAVFLTQTDYENFDTSKETTTVASGDSVHGYCKEPLFALNGSTGLSTGSNSKYTCRNGTLFPIGKEITCEHQCGTLDYESLKFLPVLGTKMNDWFRVKVRGTVKLGCGDHYINPKTGDKTLPPDIYTCGTTGVYPDIQGKWSPALPTAMCEEVKCTGISLKTTLQGKNMTPDCHGVEETSRQCSLDCDDDHYGSSGVADAIECASHNWKFTDEGAAMKCNNKKCDTSKGAPANAVFVNTSGNAFLAKVDNTATIKVECIHGFQISGGQEYKCSTDGRISPFGTAARCTKVTGCALNKMKLDMSKKNAELDKSVTKDIDFGDTVDVQCKAGFKTAKKTYICDENGSLKKKDEEIQCDKLGAASQVSAMAIVAGAAFIF